ncbi:ultraviolet-B receptor UVR8 [Arachis duranensis]|uniref:Ultraviolet-B receptor UVR8 n=1 Tax=Arachis duranensis TaxID=130453 RepID=A0A6P4DEN0_ARADU|nr:ultraviolet-B receptor UVR8 [Arachis duranensis]
MEEEERVWSWGAGTEGQLGNCSLEDEVSPQLIRQPPLSVSNISSLACGAAHVIAITSSGKVLSWGRGSSGQLGHGEFVNNSLYPKPVTSLDPYFITNVSAGWSHSAFVSDTGCLFTCGDASFGQLGHGDYTSRCSPAKVSSFDNRRVAKVACGMRHSLVLLEDCSSNQVYGFGSGKRGQLGVSKDRVKSINLPQVVSGFEDAETVDIAANGDHSAAISVDGNLYIWGRGFKGYEDANSPRRLNSTLSFTKVALGWNHALTLTAAGEVYMIGGNHLGVLSNHWSTSSAKQLHDLREANMEKVPGLDDTKVVDIAAGAEHSILVTDNGEIKTWGWGEHGQLGLGDPCDRARPVTVNLGYDMDDVSSIRVYCGSGFTFALTKL